MYYSCILHASVCIYHCTCCVHSMMNTMHYCNFGMRFVQNAKEISRWPKEAYKKQHSPRYVHI